MILKNKNKKIKKKKTTLYANRSSDFHYKSQPRHYAKWTILKWYSFSDHADFQYEQMNCSMVFLIKQNLQCLDLILLEQVRPLENKLIDKLLNNQGVI